MEKYKILFKGIHIGDLTVNGQMYEYVANEAVIKTIVNEYPIFDILKESISSKNIPFFKTRLEHKGEKFETDDYEIVAIR